MLIKNLLFQFSLAAFHNPRVASVFLGGWEVHHNSVTSSNSARSHHTSLSSEFTKMETEKLQCSAALALGSVLESSHGEVVFIVHSNFKVEEL